MSPSHVRGSLGSVSQLVVCIGILAALVVNVVLDSGSWRTMFGVATIPAVILALGAHRELIACLIAVPHWRRVPGSQGKQITHLAPGERAARRAYDLSAAAFACRHGLQCCPLPQVPCVAERSDSLCLAQSGPQVKGTGSDEGVCCGRHGLCGAREPQVACKPGPLLGSPGGLQQGAALSPACLLRTPRRMLACRLGLS